MAGDKVRNRIPRAGGRGGREGNVAIIIQIGKEHGLVESELTAKEKAVFSLGDADYVAQLIVVGTGDRTGVRVARVKARADV